MSASEQTHEKTATSPDTLPDSGPTPELSGFLLPTPLSLVCGGVLALVSAQLYVTVDDFNYLYANMGIELPWVLKSLVSYPQGLPLALGLIAVLALAMGRIPRPTSERWRSLARDASASLVLGAVAGFFLGRFTSGAILWLLWAALVGALLLFLIPALGALAGLEQDGFSRAAYVFLSWIFLAPALAASILAGWFGMRGRRAVRAGAPRDE